MKQRFVTSTEKSELFGCSQIISLKGIDEEGEGFSVSAEKASCHIRMGMCHYFLWDGDKEYLQLRAVGGTVKETEFCNKLNLEILAI